MGMRGKNRWIDIIDQLVLDINKTPHSRYKFKPIEVNKRNEKAIFNKFYNIKRKIVTPKFKVGDSVRIAESKGFFRKSFYPSFSPNLYTIVSVNRKFPPCYKLIDHKKNPLKRSYYEEEMIKAKYKNYFLIEKIIKKNRKRSLVRWWGYDPSDDSYIDNKDLDDP